MRWVPVDKLNCGPYVLDLSSRTRIMGILNVTPDSFSDGGLYLDPERAVDRAREMVSEGADLIDVGGESTRPGAAPVSASEELARILPVLRRLRRAVDVPISVDTYKASVADAALREGAHLVNAVSGFGYDSGLARVVARHGVPVVLCHVRGRPEDMQRDPRYGSVMDEICAELQENIALGRDAGIEESRFIVDPGIGFGKSSAHNLEILSRLAEMRRLQRPILLGPSRKAFLQRLCQRNSGGVKGATAAAVVMGVTGGAHIVRVHDVALIAQAVRLADAVLAASQRRGTVHA